MTGEALYLLKLMATHEFAWVVCPEEYDERTGERKRPTPKHVAELISLDAVTFPEGHDHDEERLACQITKKGLELYAANASSTSKGTEP